MELDQWLGIELRHLAALRAVAETSSFRGAAQRLGYTQSAVSQQIATLERIVGARLVERPGGPRRVSLTSVGELVLRHADAIVARLEAARSDVAAVVAGATGPLRVGTFQSAGARILPEVLRRFTTAWPGVEVRLVESPTDHELLASVERGELDVTFAMEPFGDGPLEYVELARDPWVLVVPVDSALAELETPVPLARAARLPLIGMATCRAQLILDEHLRSRRLEPRFAFRSDEITTMLGLVAAGLGAALVPRLLVDPYDDRVLALDVKPAPPPRVIAAALHRDRYRPPVADAFVAVAREVCAELAATPGSPVAA
jgi:DNA-binding transcriptional LysR family regulator